VKFTPVYGACQVGIARYCVRKVPPQVRQLSHSFHGDCYSRVTGSGGARPESSHSFLWKLGTYGEGPKEFCSRRTTPVVYSAGLRGVQGDVDVLENVARGDGDHAVGLDDGRSPRLPFLFRDQGAVDETERRG